jgi:hypothetical protein
MALVLAAIGVAFGYFLASPVLWGLSISGILFICYCGVGAFIKAGIWDTESEKVGLLGTACVLIGMWFTIVILHFQRIMLCLQGMKGYIFR